MQKIGCECGQQISENVYEKHRLTARHVNAMAKKKEVCECGKLISKAIMDKHIETITHKNAIERKQNPPVRGRRIKPFEERLYKDHNEYHRNYYRKNKMVIKLKDLDDNKIREKIDILRSQLEFLENIKA